MAKLIKELEVPIYGSKVIVSFNSSALTKYLEKNHQVEHEIPEGNAGQATVYEYESGWRFHSIYIDKDLYNVGVLAHECVHCGWHILDDVGVDLDADNHEALTYLVGWLAEEVNKFYLTGK